MELAQSLTARSIVLQLLASTLVWALFSYLSYDTVCDASFFGGCVRDAGFPLTFYQAGDQVSLTFSLPKMIVNWLLAALLVHVVWHYGRKFLIQQEAEKRGW